MSEGSRQQQSGKGASGRKTREPTVGAPRPAAAPKERAASTKTPPYGLTAEEADFVDEQVDREVRTGQLDRGSSSEQSAGQSKESDQNVTWEFIGSDDSAQPGVPPPRVAEHPEEVVRNVIEAMGRQDAKKMRQFLALSKEILTGMCKECEVLSSGTNLCRAMELTAFGASPGAPTLPTRKLERRIPDLFPPENQHEIESLYKGVGKDALKRVCTRRGMENSSTKIGLAVCIAMNKDRKRLYARSEVDAYDESRRSRSGSSGSDRGTARAQSRAGCGRGATDGEDAAAGLTPEGTSCRTPFAHFPAIWSGAWVLAGIATTTTISWVYTTTCWAVSVTTRGTEVIDEVAVAMKQSINRTVSVTASWLEVIEEVAEAIKRLVYRAGWVGERTFDMYGKFLDKVITQAGDVVCYLITIVAAVIGTSIICDYCRRRGPDDGPCVLP